MSESNSETVPGTPTIRRSSSSWPFTFILLAFPVALAVVLYRLDSFDPAPLPLHEFLGPTATAAARNGHLLRGSEFVGAGSLLAPEDIAYDSKSGVIYTGCADGWVKRVYLNESAADSVVENWVNTGGRPLGIATGLNNQVLVADTEKVGLQPLINTLVLSITAWLLAGGISLRSLSEDFAK